jgi:hypothetical protein
MGVRCSFSKNPVDFTPVDLSNCVLELGSDYEIYCKEIINSGLNGEILSRSNDNELDKILDILKVDNFIHRSRFKTEFNIHFKESLLIIPEKSPLFKPVKVYIFIYLIIFFY